MNANFSLPVLTSTYANFLAEMKSRDEDVAVWFEGTTSTNIPAGTKKWNSTGNKFEKWNGTAWSDLSTLYEIKVRDSDKLNGQAASYYSAANHVHNAVTTTVDGFMSYTDKVKLNAIAANANNYSHPAGDGNLHVPANGTSNSGKYLQATSTSGVYTWASLPASSLSTLGITATAAELNLIDGATSNIQVQLDNKLGVLSTAANASKLNNQSWHWSGQGGQPAWLWGGSDGTNMYVYNPVNFNVNYANSAGVANSITYGAAAWGTAQLPFGEVGTYATLTRGSSSTYSDWNPAVSAGSLYAGSQMYPARAGTWRAMESKISSGAGNEQYYSLSCHFLRIS